MKLTRHIKQLNQILNRLKSQEIIFRTIAARKIDPELKSIFLQISIKRGEMRFELLQSLKFSDVESKMHLNLLPLQEYQLELRKSPLTSDDNLTVLKAIENESILLLQDYKDFKALIDSDFFNKNIMDQQIEILEGELSLFHEFA